MVHVQPSGRVFCRTGGCVKQGLSIFLIVFFVSQASGAEGLLAARVNGTAITLRELERAADQLISRVTFHGNLSDERNDEYKHKALQDLIDRELQYQDARAQGMKPDKEWVRKQVENVKARFKSKKEYRQWLERSEMNEDDLQAVMEKNDLAARAFRKNVTDKALVSDEALKEFYAKNPERFKKPEVVKLSIISSKDEAKVKNARALIAGGQDFGSVAARMSEDMYRIKGGDLGFIHRGRIYPELEKEAFSMKVGEIRGPIKAEGSWYILLVLDKQSEQRVTFESAKDALKKELESKKAQELLEAWIAALRSKATIEVFFAGAVKQE